MKVFLVPNNKPRRFNIPNENFAVFYFSSSMIWFYRTIDRCSSSDICKWLSFLNEELQLNGNIHCNKPYLQYFLIPTKEAMFQLQLSILEYKEFNCP
jgi:hypothetical protein